MIDWQRVHELKAEFDAEAFDELSALFLQEVDEAVAALSDAGGDNPSVQAERFHFLKGAALNLGFATLATQCDTAEAAAMQGAATGNLARQIADVYAISRHQFLQHDLQGAIDSACKPTPQHRT